MVCDVLQQEKNENKRVLAENEHFIALIPFAASTPFQVWLMPKAHQSNYTDISLEGISALSSLLHKVFIALDSALNTPDFNMIIHSAPVHAQETLGIKKVFHWYLEIFPRLSPGSVAGKLN